MKLLWVTNLPAPYRRVVFDNLAEQVDLRVLYLAHEVADRPWEVDSSTSYLSRTARAGRVPGTGTDRMLHVLLESARHDLGWADVVVLGSWESPAYLQIALMSQALRKPLVLFYESHLHSNRFSGRHPIARVRALMVRLADSVLTGGLASTRAVRAMGAPEDKIVTGFNTVDVEGFAAAVTAARASLKVAPRGHIFLFVGRLLGLKNIDSLLDAFGLIANPEDRLVIVGDGPEREAVLASIASLDRSHQQRVELAGSRTPDQLAAIYASSHTLVLPSTTEVWGMVVNEALASGLHTVVSDRTGVAPSVEAMRGVFVSGTTAGELATAMSASRAAWTGPVADPEILVHTPARSADDALRAAQLALTGQTA